MWPNRPSLCNCHCSMRPFNKNRSVPMNLSWVADAEINFWKNWKEKGDTVLPLHECDSDRPVYFHVLGQSRCQDMSSENTGLDVIGSIFCQLDQWIVSGPPSKRRSEKKNKNKTRQEDMSARKKKSIAGSCLLSANGWGRWCVVICLSLQFTVDLLQWRTTRSYSY